MMLGAANRHALGANRHALAAALSPQTAGSLGLVIEYLYEITATARTIRVIYKYSITLLVHPPSDRQGATAATAPLR